MICQAVVNFLEVITVLLCQCFLFGVDGVLQIKCVGVCAVCSCTGCTFSSAIDCLRGVVSAILVV